MSELCIFFKTFILHVDVIATYLLPVPVAFAHKCCMLYLFEGHLCRLVIKDLIQREHLLRVLCFNEGGRKRETEAPLHLQSHWTPQDNQIHGIASLNVALLSLGALISRASHFTVVIVWSHNAFFPVLILVKTFWCCFLIKYIKNVFKLHFAAIASIFTNDANMFS